MGFKGTNETWFRSGLEIVSMPSQVKIAKVSGANFEEAKANTALIVKSKAMLEMLKKIVLVTENFDISKEDFRERYNKEIRQLIQQATKKL